MAKLLKEPKWVLQQKTKICANSYRKQSALLVKVPEIYREHKKQDRQLFDRRASWNFQ